MAGAAPRAAFFDVDGTLAGTNVVFPFAAARLRELPRALRFPWAALFLLRCALFLLVDCLNRSLFQRIFYRCYRGRDASAPARARLGEAAFDDYIKPKLFPRALQHIRQLRERGFEIVLVTGGLDFVAQRVGEALGAAHVIAAELEEEDGKFTGRLQGAPVSDAEKGRRIRSYAAAQGLDLARCHAYGDSRADLGMLEAVGHPHAVSPSGALQRLADQRGWPVLKWD